MSCVLTTKVPKETWSIYIKRRNMSATVCAPEDWSFELHILTWPTRKENGAAAATSPIIILSVRPSGTPPVPASDSPRPRPWEEASALNYKGESKAFRVHPQWAPRCHHPSACAAAAPAAAVGVAGAFVLSLLQELCVMWSHGAQPTLVPVLSSPICHEGPWVSS